MSGRIFINYRRGDAPDSTGRLYDRLEAEFSQEDLFMDVEGHIKPGDDFVHVLSAKVAQCDVLLAIIGPHWESFLDARAGSPEDFVAIEIKAALDLGKRVIPVLVGGANFPRADRLPEDIRALARRNAVGLRPDRFKADCQGLIAALKEQLSAVQAERSARSQAEREIAEQARRQEEEAAAQRAAEAERRAREQAIAGLTPEEIRKFEELSNWKFVSDRQDVAEVRDHLARFPNGTSERYALALLETLVWRNLEHTTDKTAVLSFIDEFPKGDNIAAANAKLVALENIERVRRSPPALPREASPAAGRSAIPPAGQRPLQGSQSQSIKTAAAEASRSNRLEAFGLALGLLALANSVGFVPQWSDMGRLPIGNTAWVVICVALALMGTFAALSLSARRRTKASDASVYMTFGAIGLFWILIGYTLAYTNGGGWTPWIGGLSKLVLSGVNADSLASTYSNGVYIPEFAFAAYTFAVAGVSAAYLRSAFGTRISMPMQVLALVLWVAAVHVPVAHMVWYWPGPDAFGNAAKVLVEATGDAKNAAQAALDATFADTGLVFRWGALDFGGGLVIGAAAGISGLIASYIFNPAAADTSSDARNPSKDAWIAVLTFFAWTGLISGANLESNAFAVLVLINIAASTIAACLTWALLDRLSNYSADTANGLVLSTICGLLGSAASSGFCGPLGAVLVGFMSALSGYIAVALASRAAQAQHIFWIFLLAGSIGTLAAGVLVNPDIGGPGFPDYISKPGELSTAPYDLVTQLTAQFKGLALTLVWAAAWSAFLFKVVSMVGETRETRDAAASNRHAGPA